MPTPKNSSFCKPWTQPFEKTHCSKERKKQCFLRHGLSTRAWLSWLLNSQTYLLLEADAATPSPCLWLMAEILFTQRYAVYVHMQVCSPGHSGRAPPCSLESGSLIELGASLAASNPQVLSCLHIPQYQGCSLEQFKLRTSCSDSRRSPKINHPSFRAISYC